MFMHRLCPYKSSLVDPTASLHGLEKGEATAKTLQAGKHRRCGNMTVSVTNQRRKK